jgi:hypothetical protein
MNIFKDSWRLYKILLIIRSIIVFLYNRQESLKKQLELRKRNFRWVFHFIIQFIEQINTF